MRNLWMLATLGLLVFNTTKASAVTYNEATSGDLTSGTSFGALPQFLLDPGINTFSGEVSSEPLRSDFDGFAFIVPSGNILESITVNSSLLVAPNPGTVTFVRFLLLEANGSFGTSGFRVPSENFSLFSLALPLESGLHLLSSIRIIDMGPLGGFSRTAYTFSLNVIPSEPIPSEPIPSEPIPSEPIPSEPIPEPNIAFGLGIFSLASLVPRKIRRVGI